MGLFRNNSFKDQKKRASYFCCVVVIVIQQQEVNHAFYALTFCHTYRKCLAASAFSNYKSTSMKILLSYKKHQKSSLFEWEQYGVYGLKIYEFRLVMFLIFSYSCNTFEEMFLLALLSSKAYGISCFFLLQFRNSIKSMIFKKRMT